jgi:hypothetical protein
MKTNVQVCNRLNIAYYHDYQGGVGDRIHQLRSDMYDKEIRLFKYFLYMRTIRNKCNTSSE